MFIELASLCVFCAEPEPWSADYLSIPAAVHVQAVGTPAGGPAFDRIRIDESDRWVSGVQDLNEGSVGWVPTDLTYSDEASSLIYNIKTRRGSRTARFSETGTTRLDGLASPLAWVRLARFASEHGGKVAVQPADAGGIVAKVTLGDATHAVYTYKIDVSTHELREVRTGRVTYSYRDWRDIGDGLHLPFECEFVAGATDRVPEFRKVFKLDQAQRVSSTAPPAPTVAPDAVIDDQVAGKILRGNGEEVGPAAPVQNKPSNTGRMNYLMTGLGVGLVVIAALVFKRRGRT